jgi:hypothetical protein
MTKNTTIHIQRVLSVKFDTDRDTAKIKEVEYWNKG